MEPIPAVMLAGGKAGDALAAAAGVRYKALAPIEGRPMAAYVLDALAASECVGERLLVAPGEVAAALPQARHVADTETFLGNIMAGVGACGSVPHCLLITCDIPFITGEILTAFVTQAVERGVELAYPIIEVARCDERFPGMRRTSLRLREGRFTGGNAVVISPDFLRRVAPLIEDAFAARKAPLKLASMVGWGVLLRVVLASFFPGLLPLRLAEERIGRLVGGKVAAIRLPYPEIGADIDKPEDLAALAR